MQTKKRPNIAKQRIKVEHMQVKRGTKSCSHQQSATLGAKERTHNAEALLRRNQVEIETLKNNNAIISKKPEKRLTVQDGDALPNGQAMLGISEFPGIRKDSR